MIKPIVQDYDPTSWLECIQHADWRQLARLHDDYAASADDEDRRRIDARFSAILYDIRIGSAFRSSGRGRLSESETAIIRHLDAAAPGPLRVIDIGASDGSTTGELVDALETAGYDNVEAVLADRDLVLEMFRHGSWREFRTVRGEPVFATFGDIGQRLTAGPLTDWYLSRPWRGAMEKVTVIPLVQPAIAADQRIEQVRFDIFAPPSDMAGSFRVARICNLLNREYFSAGEIGRALVNSADLLQDGGLLLVARNHGKAGGEDQRGTLFRRQEGGLEVVERYGGGSEIEDIAPTAEAAA
jgi:hypothetical protein